MLDGEQCVVGQLCRGIELCIDVDHTSQTGLQTLVRILHDCCRQALGPTQNDLLQNNSTSDKQCAVEGKAFALLAPLLDAHSRTLLQRRLQEVLSDNFVKAALREQENEDFEQRFVERHRASPPEPHARHARYLAHLPQDLLKRILQVYVDLTRSELLLRCLKKWTQNPNESLHSKLWLRCSKAYCNKNLYLTKAVTEKALELYRALKRGPVILLGAPATGKKTLVQMVHQAITEEDGASSLKLQMVYPDSLSHYQLYGDTTCRDGVQKSTDGVITKALRNKNGFLVLDGELDCNWSLCLQQALRKGGVLNLYRGGFVKPHPSLKLVFITTSISNAPAGLLTGCEVIALPNDLLSWQSVLHQHLQAVNTQVSAGSLRRDSSRLHTSRSSERSLSSCSDISASHRGLEAHPSAETSLLPPNRLRVSDSLSSGGSGGSGGSLGGGRPPHRSFSSMSGHSNTWKTEHTALVEVLAHWLLPPVTAFVRQECKSYASSSEAALARPLFTPFPQPAVHPFPPAHCPPCFSPLFTLALLLVEEAHKGTESIKDRSKMAVQWTVASFLHSTAVCFGASLLPQFWSLFNVFMRRLVFGEVVEHPPPPALSSVSIPYPADGNVLDVMFDWRQRSLWRAWTDASKNASLEDSLRAPHMLVTTPESFRVQTLISTLRRGGRPVMVVGVEGSGWREVCRSSVIVQGDPGAPPPLQRSLVVIPVTRVLPVAQVKEELLSCMEDAAGGEGVVTVYMEELQSSHALQEFLRQMLHQKSWLSAEHTSVEGGALQWVCGASARISSPLHHSSRGGRLPRTGGCSSMLDPRLLTQLSVVTAAPSSREVTSKVVMTQLTSILRAGGYVPDMFSVVSGIVSATMSVVKYFQTAGGSSPSSVGHYASSIATVSRVLQGITLATKHQMENKRHFLRLWLHEVCREYGDGLNSVTALQNFHRELFELVRIHFKENPNTLFEKLVDGTDEPIGPDCIDRLNWTHVYVKEDKKEHKEEKLSSESDFILRAQSQPYDEIFELDDMKRFVSRALCVFNKHNEEPINFTVCTRTVQHLSRLVRVLRRPSSHCLLIGRSGCGRRPLTRLAAAISGAEFCCPPVRLHEVDVELSNQKMRNNQDYHTRSTDNSSVSGVQNEACSEGRDENNADFDGMLRTAILSCCLEDKPTVFYLGTETLQSSETLHVLQTLVSVGIPHWVLSPMDVSLLLQHWQLQRDGCGQSRCHLWQKIQQKVKDDIHVFLAVSANAGVDEELRAYPCLYSSLTRHHLSEWSPRELEEMGEMVMASTDQDLNHRSQVLQGAIALHLRARSLRDDLLQQGVHSPPVSPGSFIRLLHKHQALYTSLRVRYTKDFELHRQGVETLQFTESQIGKLAERKDSLGPKIKEALAKLKEKSLILAKVSSAADAAQAALQKEELAASKLELEAQRLQKECDDAVGDVLRELHDSVEALAGLKPSDAVAAGNSKAPPAPLKSVMASMCILMDLKLPKGKQAGGKAAAMVNELWVLAKKLLLDPGFLQQVQELDPDSVSEQAVDCISREFLKSPDFELSLMSKLSPVAELLCRWVRAVVEYRIASKGVSPKKEELLVLQEKVSEMLNRVTGERERAAERERERQECKSEHASMLAEHEALTKERNLTITLLIRAQAVQASLSHHKSAWEAAASAAATALNCVAGRSLLAAAALLHLSHLPYHLRKQHCESWADTLAQLDLSVGASPSSAVLDVTTAGQLAQWHLTGLPDDPVAAESASCIINASRAVLVLDPLGLAWRWLQQLHEQRALVLDAEDVFDCAGSSQQQALPGDENQENLIHRQSNHLEASSSHGRTISAQPVLCVGNSSTSSKLDAENIKLKDDTTRRSVLSCIREGRPLLLYMRSLRWSCIDPILYDLIRCCSDERDNARTATVLGEQVRVHPELRVMIVCSSTAMHPPPRLASAITCVYFDVSPLGCEQFLRQVFVWSRRRDLDDSLWRVRARVAALQAAVLEQEELQLSHLLQEGNNILHAEHELNAVLHAQEERQVLSGKLEVCQNETLDVTRQYAVCGAVATASRYVFSVLTSLAQCLELDNSCQFVNSSVPSLTDFSATMLADAAGRYVHVTDRYVHVTDRYVHVTDRYVHVADR
ncbi:Dynein heavy chain ATP-binding dynein motor region D5 [Trinorchestia longiramus]|nr:Dynein heavy chain ATP-binding dynein motor region D5 [Trinorchestia longiramus]